MQNYKVLPGKYSHFLQLTSPSPVTSPFFLCLLLCSACPNPGLSSRFVTSSLFNSFLSAAPHENCLMFVLLNALRLNCSRILKQAGKGKHEGQRKGTFKKREVQSEQKQKVPTSVWVLAVAHSYLISKFMFPKQLHSVSVIMLAEAARHRAAVFTSHLLISATQPSKHGGAEGEEREAWDGQNGSVSRGRMNAGGFHHNKTCTKKTHISKLSSLIR